MNLTICYITARRKPKLEWFFESLERQTKPGDSIHCILVDAHWGTLPHPKCKLPKNFTHLAPKPTIWQGGHRITKQDWWAAANARNTGLCLCRTDWIAFLDDRCVLMPTWLDRVREAMQHGYAVCGAYEKRTGLVVENGIITHSGIVVGTDCREEYVDKFHLGLTPFSCPGEWMFGCTLALPVEWALEVGGYPEICDGLGMEDALFGWLIANSGHTIMYDKRMKMIEDRTPEELGEPMKREDKGVSPADKSHALLEKFRGKKNAMNSFDIRKVRADVLDGKPFPPPSASTVDWWDGSAITGT